MITMSFALGGYKDCLFSSCFTFIYIYIYIWGGLPFLTHSSSERLKYVFHPPSQPFALMEIHTLDHPSSIVENSLSPHPRTHNQTTTHCLAVRKVTFQRLEGWPPTGNFSRSRTESRHGWGYFYDINLFVIMRFGYSDAKGRIWFEARYASFLSRFKPIIEPWDMVISTEMTAGSIEIEGVVGL